MWLQVDQRINFDVTEEGQSSSVDSLFKFDTQVEHVCRSVETLSAAIAKKHPEFAVAI